MTNLSDHYIKQMDEIWQSAQSAAVVRSLLMRTLEDLRIARDRLNHNSSNNSCPPGSMAPWQSGDKETASRLKPAAGVSQRQIFYPFLLICSGMRGRWWGNKGGGKTVNACVFASCEEETQSIP